MAKETEKEKTRRMMRILEEQGRAYAKTLPKKPPALPTKKPKESMLKRLLRYLRRRRKIGGPYAEYARRTAAPKTK